MRAIARACAPFMLMLVAIVPSGHAVAAPPPVGARSPDCSQAWTIQQSPSLAIGDASLSAVTAVSSTDVWAVGSGSQGASPLIEHFDGTNWRIVAPGSPTGSSLYGVSAVDSSDVWAVGRTASTYRDVTLTEHWDGKAWSVVPSPSLPSPTSSLIAVSALASNDVWAVGAFINLLDQGSYDTLTEHWDGHAWQVVPSPNFSPVDQNFLNGVAMVSSNDVWAVGVFDIGGSGEPLILHWNGSTWSRVPGSPSGPTAALFGADAVSSNDVWAVGLNSDDQFNLRPIAERWDGANWTEAPSQPATPPAEFNAVAATSFSSAWAVGSQTSNTGLGPTDRTLIEGWDGAQWSIVPSPNMGLASRLFGITALASGSAWAVGDDTNAQGRHQALIEAYC